MDFWTILRLIISISSQSSTRSIILPFSATMMALYATLQSALMVTLQYLASD
jgi:hypothetical protein